MTVMREEDDQLYIYKLYGINKPRKIKAAKTLRAKIGPVTKILPEQIRDAQNIIDYPEIDFKPFAFAYIDKIEEAIRIATGTDCDREQYYDELVVPLSNIKGQAGMMGIG